MSLTRRNFFRLAASGLLAPVVPKLALPASFPAHGMETGRIYVMTYNLRGVDCDDPHVQYVMRDEYDFSTMKAVKWGWQRWVTTKS